jgi:elongator complex protein 1
MNKTNLNLKDPKEYIPMLNELRKLEPTYQKFTIDKHLKKYESALKHLKDCGAEHYEECLKFVADQKLHSAALKIFPPAHPLYQVNPLSLNNWYQSITINFDMFQNICKEYATNLMSSKYYEEAGIIFQRAHCFSEAVEAFRKAGCWRKIVPMVPKLGLR